MNILNSNLSILGIIYFFVKNLKTRSILYILLVTNALVFTYGLSSANIINFGSIIFILCSVVFVYFYFKKAYHKKLVSLQNLSVPQNDQVE